MHVFISWSGDQSKDVAEALDKAIRHTVRRASTFISTQDIDAGERWEARVSEELERTNHAVLCVTRDNQTSPWLNYEAGALGKILGSSRVIPYTLGFSPNELKPGPLTRFQGVENNEQGTWNLVQSLSRSSHSDDEEPFIREGFEMCWPRLRDRMAEVLAKSESPLEPQGPTEKELLFEIRGDVRRILSHVTGDALRDLLTGLPNREAFMLRANKLTSEMTAFVISYLDLDRFKRINDQFGHHRGDVALRTVAESLVEGLASADLVARIGGDEFVAIHRDTQPTAVVQCLADFVAALPARTAAAGLPPLTASVGVSTDRLESVEEKLRDADAAMYQAKHEGRGRVVLSE